MSREDDIKRRMAEIKASKHYQDYQKEHAPKIAAEKALAKKEPWRLGTTEDGKHVVWAPVAGPDAAKVLHLRRRVWMCAYCRSTFRFRGSMYRRQVVQHKDGSIEIKDTQFNPAAIVDFDGKVYHRYCYNAMKRDQLPEGKESENELQRAEGVRQGGERGLPGGVPQLPLHSGDLGCAGGEVRDHSADEGGGGEEAGDPREPDGEDDR